MKINTSEIFNRYILKIKEETLALKQENLDLNKSKEYVLKNIQEYEEFLDIFSTVKFKNLEDLNFSFFNRSLLQKKFEDNEELLAIESKVKRLLNTLIVIKRRSNAIETRLIELSVLTVNSTDFNKIIGTFNNRIIDEILKGYVFHLGYKLSYIRIKRKDVSTRKRKRVDWGESNKKKKEILDRGGIPYEVLTRDEEGKILTDNGGEYWLCYHTKQIEFLWHWARGRTPFPNKYFYKFKPTYCGAAQNGAVQKLKQLENSNSENLKYFY